MKWGSEYHKHFNSDKIDVQFSNDPTIQFPDDLSKQPYELLLLVEGDTENSKSGLVRYSDLHFSYLPICGNKLPRAVRTELRNLFWHCSACLNPSNGGKVQSKAWI
jgi:hypothetical protein